MPFDERLLHELAKEWRRRNEDNEGFLVGETHDPIEAHAKELEAAFVQIHEGVAFYEDSAGCIIGVANINGPWAIELEGDE